MARCARVRHPYKATRDCIESPRHKEHCEADAELPDHVVSMANARLRPDEAKLIELRHVTIVDDRDSVRPSLSCAVNGVGCGRAALRDPARKRIISVGFAM
jgi:hypothetical protein